MSRWTLLDLPPEPLALAARWKPRKPRKVQRTEWRGKELERATANYRRALDPLVASGANTTREPPPYPFGRVSHPA